MLYSIICRLRNPRSPNSIILQTSERAHLCLGLGFTTRLGHARRWRTVCGHELGILSCGPSQSWGSWRGHGTSADMVLHLGSLRIPGLEHRLKNNIGDPSALQFESQTQFWHFTWTWWNNNHDVTRESKKVTKSQSIRGAIAPMPLHSVGRLATLDPSKKTLAFG